MHRSSTALSFQSFNERVMHRKDVNVSWGRMKPLCNIWEFPTDAFFRCDRFQDFLCDKSALGIWKTFAPRRAHSHVDVQIEAWDLSDEMWPHHSSLSAPVQNRHRCEFRLRRESTVGRGYWQSAIQIAHQSYALECLNRPSNTEAPSPTSRASLAIANPILSFSPKKLPLEFSKE